MLGVRARKKLVDFKPPSPPPNDAVDSSLSGKLLWWSIQAGLEQHWLKIKWNRCKFESHKLWACQLGQSSRIFRLWKSAWIHFNNDLPFIILRRRSVVSARTIGSSNNYSTKWLRWKITAIWKVFLRQFCHKITKNPSQTRIKRVDFININERIESAFSESRL